MKKNAGPSSSESSNSRPITLTPELADRLHRTYLKAMEHLQEVGEILDSAEMESSRARERETNQAFFERMFGIHPEQRKPPEMNIQTIQFESLEDLAEFLRKRRDA